MRKYFLTVTLVLLSYSIGGAESFEISKSERAWLESYREISVGLVESYPPQSRVQINNTDWGMVWIASGVSIVIICLILFWISKMVLEVKRRRNAEACLVESDDRFDSVFSKISDVVIVWGTDLRLIYANQNALNYFMLDKNEVYGKKLKDVIHEKIEVTRLWEQRADEIFKDGKTRYYEDRIIIKGQETFSEESLTPLFTDSGSIYAVSLVCRDVTTRKKNENELKKYSDTQAILLREVNHRVKNNLSAIISILHMEGDKAGTLYCSQFCSQPLKAIEMRITSLLVVHSMLSSSKWQPIRLTDICRKVIRECMEGFCDASEFDLYVMDCHVLIDSDMAHGIALVLSELAANSSKYAFGEKTKLTVKVSVANDNGFNELTYSDNGPGFPETVLQGKTSEDHIGMDIMKGLVTGNMGGRFKYFNDGGASVCITFPAGAETFEIVEDAVEQ